MDDVLLAATRIALVVVAGGGSAAVIVATVVRGGRRRWLLCLSACLLLLPMGAAVAGAVGLPDAVVQALDRTWFVAFPLLAATFPDGRFVPRWSGGVVTASAVVVIGDVAVGGAWNESPWWVAFPALQLVVCVGFLAFRYRRSATTPERESVRWLLLGVVCTVAAYMAVQVGDGVIGGPGALAAAKAAAAGIPLALGLVIGIVWPRLWNVDRVFRAVLVALAAGWVLVGVAAGARAVAAAAGVAAADLWIPVATAVAVAAYPVIRLTARGATWLVHRDRWGADAAARRLVEALEAEDARSVAQRVTDVAADATGSPDVRLVGSALADAVVFRAASGSGGGGAPGGHPPAVAFPVVFRGELLAELSAVPRAGESEPSVRDRAALAAIAQHAAAALHGARALRTATSAQSALVSAREEERRALRRELHDDLGPALSGLALSAAAIARRADAVAPDLAETARELQADIADAVVRARDISHGLRPVILDDRGLEAALRARVGEAELDVGELGDLPAAVDLAALRIVQEAVTNVHRHAAASVCRVRVHRRDGDLLVEVADDGIGIPAAVSMGVGLRSIHDRAAELGGRARVSGRPTGGTVVRVELPLEVSQ